VLDAGTCCTEDLLSLSVLNRMANPLYQNPDAKSKCLGNRLSHCVISRDSRSRDKSEQACGVVLANDCQAGNSSAVRRQVERVGAALTGAWGEILRIFFKCPRKGDFQ